MKWCEVRAVGTWCQDGFGGTRWALYVSNAYYDEYLHEETARRRAAEYLAGTRSFSVG